LLTLYQLLRIAMVEAIETRPGLDPDRASFTTAVQTARDQLITAHGIDPDPATATDRLGAIGQAVLATLLPARRLRYSNRNVKCITSRYHARDDGRPTHSTDIIAIDIALHIPPLHPTPAAESQHPFRHRPPAPSKPPTPPVSTRRQLVTAILLSQPGRDWHGWELANKLNVKQRNLLTQLGQWARLGFIRRTGAGTYALDTPPPNWPPDHLTDQLTARAPG
jgi:hypothetical protein